MLLPRTGPSYEAVDDFKEWTVRKLAGVVCPDHSQPPKIHFEGSSLRDVSIRMSACCAKLSEIANRAIAER